LAITIVNFLHLIRQTAAESNTHFSFCTTLIMCYLTPYISLIVIVLYCIYYIILCVYFFHNVLLYRYGSMWSDINKVTDLLTGGLSVIWI